MEKQIAIIKAIKTDLAKAKNGGDIQGLYWRLRSYIEKYFGKENIIFMQLSNIRNIEFESQIDTNKGLLTGIIGQILDEIDEPIIEADKTESTKRETTKAYCYKCEDETNQIVLFNDSSIGTQEIVGRNEEGDESQSVWMVATTIWTLTKCQGCEKINLTHITRTDPDRKADRVFHFPYKFIRIVPTWTFKLPIKYLEILHEIYATLNQELFILSLTGTRILLDIYIVNKVGDTGTFKQKIAKLVSEGFITQAKAKVLETTIDAGNAASHRGFKPDKDTLFDILDIIENLLQSEIVDTKGEKIKEKTPQRK